MSPSRPTLLALGLIAAAALCYELALTRLLSVALWYPFAFVAIGAAMLGFGAAAVGLTLSPRLRAAAPEPMLAACAAAFAITTVLGYPLWNAIPVAPMSLASDPLQILWITLLLLVITLPFVCAGLFIAKAFAASPGAAPYLYAADLGGAAAGAVLFALLLGQVGGPGILMVSGGLALVASLAADPGPLPRRTALALALAGLFSGAAQVEKILPLRVTPNKLLGIHPDRRPLTWSVGSAIDVIRGKGGANILFDGGTAMSFAPGGTRRSVRPPPPMGFRAIAYELAPTRSTLIIGSGGGVEVRAALGAGVERIVALEIDRTVNDLVTNKLAVTVGGIFSDPSVELHTAEARGYIEALPADVRFDSIVGFHTISNAASAAGGMSLAESYTLTVEALTTLLGRISSDGVLVISRPEQQMGRLVTTLAEAWAASAQTRDLGQHVAIVSTKGPAPAFIVALVVSQRPLTPEAIARLEPKGMTRVLYAPDGGDNFDYYRAILSRDRDAAEAARAALPFVAAQLAPSTDDQPFFNLPKPWSEISGADLAAVFGAGERARLRLEDLPVAQVAVLIFLFVLIALTAVTVAPTLIALRRRGIPPATAARVAIPFAAYGLGYILVEVILIQRLTRIVGEPGWSIVTVLAVMLFFSGVGGAFLVGRLNISPRRACLVAFGAALFVALIAPLLIGLAAPWPFAARVLVGVAIVAPVGFALGGPFAATLRGIDSDALVAWAWAQNSLFGVAGSLAALILSSALGFTVAALLASITYAIAWATYPKRGLP